MPVYFADPGEMEQMEQVEQGGDLGARWSQVELGGASGAKWSKVEPSGEQKKTRFAAGFFGLVVFSL